MCTGKCPAAADNILGKVDTLMAAINSRGFGDPPYEGPEYEKYINVENQ